MTDLERLKALLDSERVKLGVHIRKMNSPGSPIYRAWENIWPAAAILIGSFLGTTVVHFYVGVVILAAGCWWWLAVVLPRIKDGVFERSAAYALLSEAHFDALWGKGILSLYSKQEDGSELAAAMRDDWRVFVRQLMPPTEGETG